MFRNKLVYEDETLRQGVSRNIHVAVWFDAPTIDQMHAYGRCARRVYARYRGQSAFFNLVVDGRPTFSNEVRKAAADYTGKGLHQIGAAHVVLVPGFLGVSTRAFFSTMLLLGRPPNPTKVFADIESAALWQAANLAVFPDEEWNPGDIVDVCRKLTLR